MSRRHHPPTHGFSLLEILLVVAILMVLVGIAVPLYFRATERARATEARYELAVLELRANAPDLALNEFRQVVQLRPEDVMAWNGLGLAYARIGALGEARQALEHAKTLEPTNVSTLSNLGLLAAYEQRWNSAREVWQSTLELDPRFAPAAKNLETLNTLMESTPR